MTTADRSENANTTSLDVPDERDNNAELISPGTPTAKEPEAISPAVSGDTVVASKKELDGETQKRGHGKQKWIVLLTVLIIVAAGISIFLYMQNRP